MFFSDDIVATNSTLRAGFLEMEQVHFFPAWRWQFHHAIYDFSLNETFCDARKKCRSCPHKS